MMPTVGDVHMAGELVGAGMDAAFFCGVGVGLVIGFALMLAWMLWPAAERS